MLLALDLNSKRSGYAFGRPKDTRPLTGDWPLPGGEDIARTGGILYDSITSLAQVTKPKIILIEAPMQANDRSAHTAKVLIMLFGVAMAASRNAGARGIPVAVSTWRKHFIGRGDYPGDVAKQMAFDRCRMLRWEPKNHDQAEACGVWSFGISTYFRAGAAESAPLFSGSVAA